METQTLARCARCAARTPAGGGLCGHATCDTPAHARHAVTDVAGTSACEDCAGPLLDLVLHPLQVIYVPVDDRAGRAAGYVSVEYADGPLHLSPGEIKDLEARYPVDGGGNSG